MKTIELAQGEPTRDRSNTVDKLEDELEAFEALRGQLLQTHRGLYVAIHRGKVFKFHADELALAAMIDDVAAEEGPIAICKVEDRGGEGEPEYSVADFESPILSEDGA